MITRAYPDRGVRGLAVKIGDELILAGRMKLVYRRSLVLKYFTFLKKSSLMMKKMNEACV